MGKLNYAQQIVSGAYRSTRLIIPAWSFRLSARRKHSSAVLSETCYNDKTGHPSGCRRIYDTEYSMRNELTKKDIDEMQAEIDHRKLELRPKLLEEVKETRAQGDLSENYEYHAAKQAKNHNDARIRYLERMIKTARVIPEQKVPAGVAALGRKVTIYIPGDDAEECYTITSTVREDSLKGLISVESPLGRALLNHHVGDTVTVHVSSSYSYDLIIRKIENADDEGEIRAF